jgi:hypothetical protein
MPGTIRLLTAIGRASATGGFSMDTYAQFHRGSVKVWRLFPFAGAFAIPLNDIKQHLTGNRPI